MLIPNPRDIPGFIKELGQHRFTVITGVNTLFNALLNNPEFARLDFSTLRVSLGGGMAVQQVVAEKWKKVTGVTLVEAYGLTETSPAACINPMDLKGFNGSIGLPVPSTNVAVATWLVSVKVFATCKLLAISARAFPASSVDRLKSSPKIAAVSTVNSTRRKLYAKV